MGAGSIQEISPPLSVAVNLKILQKIVLKEERKRCYLESNQALALNPIL